MAVNRFERLDRHELPIQAVVDRSPASFQATVPLHMSIFWGLRDGSPRLDQVAYDKGLLKDAYKVVGAWYDEDMDYHLGALEPDERKSAERDWKNYLRFNLDWTLGSSKGTEVLDLTVRHNGTRDVVAVQPDPIALLNVRKASGEYYGPEMLKGDSVEIIGKPESVVDFVFLSPEKMLQYGIEVDQFRVDHEVGVARVLSTAFRTDYLTGNAAIPRAFLLRNYSVFYANRLLDSLRVAMN